MPKHRAKSLSDWHSLYASSSAPARPKRVPAAPQIEHEPAATTSVTGNSRVKRSPPKHVRPTRSSIRSLRKPAPFVPPSKRKDSKVQKRPSLSDQLKSIGASASAITNAIRKQAGDEFSNAEAPLHIVPSLELIVGNLRSRFPSPVSFFRDRCEYAFRHPYDNRQIDMKMYYADMTQVAIRNRVFRFKVPRPLKEFGNDYKCRDPNHLVKIAFNSSHDQDIVKSVFVSVQRRR